MKGKAKLVRKEDGNYYAYVKNYFWQKWKPLYDSNNKQISFKTMREFGKVTRIECFDEIIVKYDKFSGLGRYESE